MKSYTTTNETEARAIANALDSGIYYLAHGEYSRPIYKVRKVRGRNEFEIYAKYYYFAGTLNRRPNGAICIETAHLAKP
jgi:hypothetical protein